MTDSWINPYIDQPPAVWDVADGPTVPPASETAAGHTGTWTWYEEAGPEGTIVRRYPVWVRNPIPTAPEKHRRTAREVIAAIREDQTALDTLLTTFKALGNGATVAQHRRFTVDSAELQTRLNRNYRRAIVLLLDAGDGNEAESSALRG